MHRHQTLLAIASGLALTFACGCSDTHSGGVGSGTTPRSSVGGESTTGVNRTFGQPEWVGLPPGLLSPDYTRIVTVRLKEPTQVETIYEITYSTVVAATGAPATKDAALVTDLSKEPASPNLSPESVTLPIGAQGFSFLVRALPTIGQDYEVTVGVRRPSFPNELPAKRLIQVDNGNGVFPG